MSQTRVVFFQVRTAADKLTRIAQTARHHFDRKERFLIVAEDDKALQFVDELLWKTPIDSFLPHTILERETAEWIALTKVKKNLNEARLVFNLCSTPLLIDGPFRIIYDFEDATAPTKKSLSQMRFEAYKQAHYLIESQL